MNAASEKSQIDDTEKTALSNGGRLRIYTLFSPSHEVLHSNYLLPSIISEHETIIVRAKQLCDNASHMSKGWDKICYEKVKLFYDACQHNLGGYFAFFDSDIEIFSSNIFELMIDELGDYDIACQRDGNDHCSGLFIVRCNEATNRLFRTMMHSYSKEDQHTLNKFVHTVRHKFLSSRFYNYSLSKEFNSSVWYGGKFNVPNDIVAFHANWTVGVNSKERMLKYVKHAVYGRII